MAIVTRASKGEPLSWAEIDANFTQLHAYCVPLSGDGAPASTPDFIGQHYIDTTNRRVYMAMGTSTAGDWTELGTTLVTNGLSGLITGF